MMPSPTSVANHNVKRRRRRHRRSRNNATSGRSGRSNRNPQLREQSSDDLEACFGLCQKRGLRLDPDVRIGAAFGALGQRFSFLENIESSSQTPTVITPPSESSFSELHSVADESSFQTVPDEISLELDTIPSTLPSAPRVRLPGLRPSQTDPADPELNSPTFLREFPIPSPLLYHKTSREDFFGLIDDNEHARKEKSSLRWGQNATDVDFEYSSVAVGRPLKRIFRDDHSKQSSDDVTADISKNKDIPAAHEIGFYQSTRSYLTPSSEDGQSSAARVVSNTQLGRPITTSTNTRQKRKANGCPREFVLQTPAASPFSTRSTSCWGQGISEWSHSSPGTSVKDHQSRNYQDQIHHNSGLARPPSEPSRSPFPDLPTEKFSKHRNGRADVRRSQTRIPRPVVSSDVESQTPQNPSRARHNSGRASKTKPARNHTCQTESATVGDARSSQSKSKFCAASKIKKQHFDPSSPRPTYASIAAASSPPPSPAVVRVASSAGNGRRTSAVPTPKLVTLVTSQTATLPIPDLDVVQIRACSTPDCLGLLLTPQTIGDMGKIDMFAQDLGFEIEHQEGCESGTGTGTGTVIDGGKQMEDSDARGIGKEEEYGSEEEIDWVRLGLGEGEEDDELDSDSDLDLDWA